MFKTIKEKLFAGAPLKVFFLCFSAYAFAYFCRVNLSIAMPFISKEPGFDASMSGMIGSCFFWVYAFGQLINSIIGDKVKPTLIVFIGLFASAVMNFVFGFTNNFWAMLLLWGVNGFFQSMLWGPILRILSENYSKKVKNTVATGMTLATILGYIVVWCCLSYAAELVSWRWVFWIPSVLVGAYAILWLVLTHQTKKQNQEEEEVQVPVTHPLTTAQVLRAPKMIFFMLSCILHGMVKEGVTLWLPTMIVTIFSVSLQDSAGYMLFVPIISTFGVIASSALYAKTKSKVVTVNLLFALSMAFCLVGAIFDIPSVFLMVIVLSLISGFISGVNNILLSLMPLEYAPNGKTATVGGIMNFCTYLGAAISAAAIGFMMNLFGIKSVLWMWAVICLLGIGSTWLAKRVQKKTTT